MATTTVLVRRLAQLHPDLRRAPPTPYTAPPGDLRGIARIVSEEARRRLAQLSPPPPRSVSGIRPRVRTNAAVAEQARRKTTGKRADWGSRQMQHALSPALDAKEAEVVVRLERMLDNLGRDLGF